MKQVFLCLVFWVGAVMSSWGQAPPDPAVSPNASGFVKLADQHELFQTLKDPLLALGHMGTRVRELQTTLNMELGERIITLEHPIWVTSVQKLTERKEWQQRLAYSKRRKIIFQIRGDWEPCDAAGTPLVYPEDVNQEGIVDHDRPDLW